MPLFNPRIAPTMTTLTTGTSATYTPPAGCIGIWVRACGGGGGSGGCSTGIGAASAGGGGGGGGYVEKMIPLSILASSYTYTVGAGGTAGSAGGNGGTGGATSFAGGSVTLTANGGGPGPGAAGTSSTPVFTSANGGAGGTASGGDINVQGGMGAGGIVLSGTQAAAGAGGNSVLGMAAQSQENNGQSAGITGQNYGGGATGGLSINNGSVEVGAIGGGGLILITEFYT